LPGRDIGERAQCGEMVAVEGFDPHPDAAAATLAEVWPQRLRPFDHRLFGAGECFSRMGDGFIFKRAAADRAVEGA